MTPEAEVSERDVRDVHVVERKAFLVGQWHVSRMRARTGPRTTSALVYGTRIEKPNTAVTRYVDLHIRVYEAVCIECDK